MTFSKEYKTYGFVCRHRSDYSGKLQLYKVDIKKFPQIPVANEVPNVHDFHSCLFFFFNCMFCRHKKALKSIHSF